MYEKLEAYELVREQEVKTLNAKGLLFKHKKTGARICVLSNDDHNKVFQVGFRTPPTDDTGVAHIIEHTVLCGSDKFPVKDPFIELAKGSLNTFLNAITYPDKTIYPVASCNEKDYQNLMDVYLDAVFHPNIYKYEEIFKQEGWHYELENIDAPLTLNGVVYNEMKGAYSDPEDVLQHEIEKALFPDTCYANESGGHPDHIYELTREEYLDFHRRYYHPSNSFIYFYGDMDVEEKLGWLDQNYLSKYDFLDIATDIGLQESFSKPVKVEKTYPISNSDSMSDNSMLSYNTVVGTTLDPKIYIAMEVINYALLNAPGAALKQALVDAKLGKSIDGSYMPSQRQPIFSVLAKGASDKDADRFVEIIKKELTKIVEQGFSKEALEAGINSSEFKYREGDFGQFPKGLIYCIQSMDSWLYDEKEPFIHIDALDTYSFLREQIKGDYFEQLVKIYLLDNPHAAVVVLNPEKGLNEKNQKALEAMLAKRKEEFTKEELQKLVDDTRHLKEYQSEPSTQEQLETIPMLSRKDIEKKAQPITNETKNLSGVLAFHHDLFTNGIHYMTLMFNIKKLPEDLIPYVGLLKTVFSMMDTEEHSYAALSNDIDRFTGGIHSTISIYQNFRAKNDSYSVKFEVKAKTFYNQMPRALELIAEIIESTKYDDYKRLYEIIAEVKETMGNRLSSSGHIVSSLRSMTYYSTIAMYKDMTKGIGYYRFISNLEKNFDLEKATISSKLRRLTNIIFRKENLTISSTCNQEEFGRLEKAVREFNLHLYDQDFSFSPSNLEPQQKNEAFTDASQVQYVSRSGSYKAAGYDYVGAMRVAKVMFGYDYLWTEIRVKGGAYGCGGGFSRTGDVNLTSYRDPNLGKTIEVYEKAPEYLKNFTATERDLTKFVIGTISVMDTPLNPAALGDRSMTLYLSNLSEQDIQKERDEVLNVTVEDIRALAEPLQAALDQNNLCVIGNEQKIMEEKELFKSIESLIGGTQE